MYKEAYRKRLEEYRRLREENMDSTELYDDLENKNDELDGDVSYMRLKMELLNKEYKDALEQKFKRNRLLEETVKANNDQIKKLSDEKRIFENKLNKEKIERKEEFNKIYGLLKLVGIDIVI